jgi:hypothetical protein
VRKIFSIVITLGLVLGLSLIAMPAAAWDCVVGVPVADVVVDPDCACEEAAYNISFNTSASLTEGVHSVCIEFPAGTTIPDEFGEDTVFISVDGNPHVAVFPDEITVTGTTVCFIVPVSFDAGEILVEFTIDAGLENPCDPDDYSLWVYTDRAPDSTPLEGEYTIVPAVASYAFLFDFNDTYPGILSGFVPPFRACGQPMGTEAQIEAGWITVNGSDISMPAGWYDEFNLNLVTAVPGCVPPCINGTVWFELTAIPDNEEIHLLLDGVNYTMDVCNITATVGKFDPSTDWKIDAALPLPISGVVASWEGFLHFSSPGTYTLCFYVECPDAVCTPGGIVTTKCQDFVVHQDKDAAKIILEEKWNLISLPLEPFDTSIESLMAAWNLDLIAPAGVSELVSIHYFDQCTDTWSVYGNGQTSLSTMEAGKSYWVRMVYPAPQYTLWVFGTARPMPPQAPAIYTMCDGWNMFGFTSLVDQDMTDYLWNFGGAGEPDYPLVYTWWNPTGDWFDAQWYLMDPTTPDWMLVGEGYWGYFPNGGTIVP